MTEIIKLKETAEEFYEIKNDKCPLCDTKFITISPIVRIEDRGICLNCWLKMNSNK